MKNNSPNKEILLNTRHILDILQSENREDRLKEMARSIGLLAGRLERLDAKHKKRESKIKKATS